MDGSEGEERSGREGKGRIALGSVRAEPARRRLGAAERAAREPTPPLFSFDLPRLRPRLASFGYAFSGLRQMLEHEPHARIHLAATALTLILAAMLGVSAADWRWLLLAIALVWIAEAFNTAVEALGDQATEEEDPLIKRAKDVAAAGVLVAAMLAVAIAALTFWPYLAPLLT